MVLVLTGAGGEQGGHGGYTQIPYIVPYTSNKNTIQYCTFSEKNTLHTVHSPVTVPYIPKKERNSPVTVQYTHKK